MKYLIYEASNMAEENENVVFLTPKTSDKKQVKLTVIDAYFGFWNLEGLEGFVTNDQLIKIFGSRAEYELISK